MGTGLPSGIYDENFSSELSIQDIIENEDRNISYREASMEEELLCKYCVRSDDPEDFRTASDIVTQLSCINTHLNIYNMERALNLDNHKINKVLMPFDNGFVGMTGFLES